MHNIAPQNWIEVAFQYLGFPSVLYSSPDKGNTPDGFDCSGFVQYTLLEAGVPLPSLVHAQGRTIRHTNEFFDFFGVLVHDKLARQGDIVFFSRNGRGPTHMGFYLGEGRVLHSPGVDDSYVMITPVEKLCRELHPSSGDIYAHNPIGYKRPAIALPEKQYQQVLRLDELDSYAARDSR